jgi:hypothetical protein
MAEVSGDEFDQIELYLAPEKLKVDYQRKVKGGSGSVLGSKNLFNRVRDKMLHHQRDTVVFVHGYNVSFADALASAARLKQKFSTANNGPGISVVLFSWPSDGSMMSYIVQGNDRPDAAASGPAFAPGLAQARRVSARLDSGRCLRPSAPSGGALDG